MEEMLAPEKLGMKSDNSLGRHVDGSVQSWISDRPEPDAIENYTNRSPYPMLHVLREASVERAVEAFPDATQIYEKNIATLRLLGHDGWRRLGVGREPPGE